MAGETSDAISAYTQVKMTEAPRLLRMPSRECLEILDQDSSTAKIQKLGMILKTQWYFVKETYMVTHWLAFCGEENLKKCYLKR